VDVGGVEAARLQEPDGSADAGVGEGGKRLAVCGDDLSPLAWPPSLLAHEVELEVIVAGQYVVESIGTSVYTRKLLRRTR
jgi:hypothetical protein